MLLLAFDLYNNNKRSKDVLRMLNTSFRKV